MSWFGFLNWGWWKPPKPKKKALWVWSFPSNQAEFLKFCQERKINELYLSVDLNINLNQLQTFVTAAKQLGISTQYLEGDAINENSNAQAAISRLKRVLSWNIFEGCHLDHEQEGDNLQAYNSFLEAILPTARGFKRLEFDMRFGANNLTKDILNKYCDSVTVMAYRNNIRDIIGAMYTARKNLKLPFVVGLETGKSNEGDFISFYGQTLNDLHEAIKQIERYYRWNNKFKGVALHYHSTYKEMQ